MGKPRRQSVEAWLKSRTSLAPAGVDVLSSGKVKADSMIPGMYYTTLKIKLNGKTGTGTAMACPGIDGAVRLLRLYAHNSSFGDMLSGGKYLENVCKKEPKGKASAIATAPSAPVAQTPPRASIPKS